MNTERIEDQLAQLPLYGFFWISPEDLEFSQRIRWICEHECPMYGKTWACPPGVGTVEQCQKRCLSYTGCLMVATVTQVEDISNLEETLATRGAHEEISDRAAAILRSEGLEVYTLSTEACAICDSCAILEGKPCRYPEKMHPCVESHGIVLSQVAEDNGMPFQYGDNVVTWFSLLFYK